MNGESRKPPQFGLKTLFMAALVVAIAAAAPAVLGAVGIVLALMAGPAAAIWLLDWVDQSCEAGFSAPKRPFRPGLGSLFVASSWLALLVLLSQAGLLTIFGGPMRFVYEASSDLRLIGLLLGVILAPLMAWFPFRRTVPSALCCLSAALAWDFLGLLAFSIDA